MEKLHKKHLKTRSSPVFNIQSKIQEDTATEAAQLVWDEITKKYPQYKFSTLQSLGMKDFSAHHALAYINRGLLLSQQPLRNSTELQAITTSSGIKPDGGIFFIQSKIDGFNHIITALEVKHQGEYDGYTPLSDSDWKKKNGDPTVAKNDRPPQAQGNAIERFAKNANAIRTLTSFYDYNPYVVFCEGFDFFLKKDIPIFSHLPYAQKYSHGDSPILMRLIAGNDWLPLNKIYVTGIEHGEGRIHPATIFAQMPKWTARQIADILLEVIDKAITHLHHAGEI